MARILTPDEIRQVPRAGIVWIEFYDGELGRSTGLLCAMMCKDGSLVDEEGSFFKNYEQDRCPYWADKQCVSDMHMDAMEVIDNLEERIAIMSEGLPDV